MTTKYILPTLISIVLPVLMASCSAEEDSTVRTEHSAVIIPTATLNMAQTSSKAGELSGPVSGTTFPKDTKNVFAVTDYLGNAVPTKDYNIAYFHNQSVSSDNKGEMTFNTPQYYHNTGKLYFYAYSPVTESGYNKGNATVQPNVTFDIADKVTDILWAKQEKGIAKADAGKTQEHPSFAFEHKLQQLRFKFVKGGGLETGCKVTEISVTGNPTSTSDNDNKLKGKAILNLITGNVAYEGDNVEHKLEKLSCDIQAAADAKEINECFLTRPVQKIKLTIKYTTPTGDNKTVIANVDLNGAQTDKGGKSYLLTINFTSGLDVIITVEENNDWQDGAQDPQTIGS